MLVKDLKNVLKDYNSLDKDKLIIELYKRIPKRVKEEYEIDNYIININDVPKKEKANKEISLEELVKEIHYFIDCAKKGLYQSPNRIISKSERSKWRFKVISFYKDLNKFDAKTVDGNKATDLLIELYKLMSYSSNYLTFSNWETFRAIKVEQKDFYYNIINRKFAYSIDEDVMKVLVNLFSVESDPYGYGVNALVSAFVDSLTTNDMKTMALEMLLDKHREFKGVNTKKLSYSEEEKINMYVTAIFDINILLGTIDKGIEFFHKNYIARDKEIREYVLLNRIAYFDLDEVWVAEYEKHLGKIDYRDSLKEDYKKYKGE